MFSGTSDGTCPHKQAQDYAAIIGDDVVYFDSPKGENHEYWTYACTDDIIELIVAQLQAPSDNLSQEFLQ